VTQPFRIAAVALVVLGHARAAAAHDEALTNGPSSWDAAVMALLAAGAVMYLIGTLKLSRRGAHVRTAERAAFWIGWASMFAAVAPPMDAAAAIALLAHGAA